MLAGMIHFMRGTPYIYQGEGGKQFTRVASYDMYVTGRILSAAEAKELAALSDSDAGYLTTEDGSCDLPGI